jgi:topoisomerase IA-like protein
MLRKIKKWFGFPLVTENLKEVQSILEERLKELEMAEKKAVKKAPAKKAPAKKAPAKKAPAKKAPAKKKSGGSGKPQQAL